MTIVDYLALACMPVFGYWLNAFMARHEAKPPRCWWCGDRCGRERAPLPVAKVVRR